MYDPSDLSEERNVRILAIDDNEQIHTDYRKILEGGLARSPSVNASKAAFFGTDIVESVADTFEIDSAYQGRDGFDMACQAFHEGRPYAMAFVDIRMPPGWDGVETIKHIWSEDPDLQVVVCSAYSDYSWDDMVKELGQSDKMLILKKPFDNIEVRQLACAMTHKWSLARKSRFKRDELEKMIEERTAALAKSEAHSRAIIESAHDCIISIDHTGKIIEFNRAAETTFGFARSAAMGRNMSELIIPPARRADHRHGLERYLTTGESKIFDKTVELTAMRQDGSELPVEATITAIRLDDGPPSFTAILRDVKERKQLEAKLRHDALHDALTGLPNRALFIDRLDNTIKRCARRAEYLFAVLFLDLDRFKNVNDSLGHLAGDQLLVGAAHRLQSCIRTSDTIARLGGDEFAILVDDITEASDAVRLAERLHRALNQPFRVDGEELFTTTSIGIALSATGYDRAEEILRDADTAMYRAKSQGKACFQMFSTEMHSQAKQTLTLENELRRAIERHEFCNFYQPIVSLETDRIMGFEALVRWQHPTRGLLAPAEFLKVAEDAGLMITIGWCVLREACQQLRQWHDEFPGMPGLTMSVNVSPKQIVESDLVENIHRIITETGVDVRSLTLEITEDAVIDNMRLATAVMSQLKLMGIRLSIDDFGTGYSSLNHLHSLPFDTMKIDRSFINDSFAQPGHGHIVQAIIGLSHDLGMSVVAEGVETEAQQALLCEMNCDYGQGYLFARPLDHETARQFLANAIHLGMDSPFEQSPAHGSLVQAT